MTSIRNINSPATQPPSSRHAPRIGLVRAVVAAFVLAASVAGADRHIRCENDFYKYDAAFDEKELSPREIKAARLLSPYCENSLGTLLVVSDSVDPKTGRGYKGMIVDGLESCPEGRPGCPRIIENLDAAFLSNAARNLDDDRRNLSMFESMDVPPLLEPIHRHYIFTARLDLEVQTARYEFLKSGDPDALRKTLCKYCPCGPPEDATLHAIEATQGKAKIEATAVAFPNRIRACLSPHFPAYPWQAWRDFVAAHHIRETFTEIPIE